MNKTIFTIFFLLFTLLSFSQKGDYQIAVLKYNGGGDWYANLETSLPNLISFVNKQLKTNINPEQAVVEPSNPEIFSYPFIHMTGHGNVIFNQDEVENLRNYLNAGGFLHIDDNYGMDPFIRRELKKLFPNNELVEIPFDHPIYNQQYKFTNGPPKIHEHDNKEPMGLGIILDGRLVIYYTYESDLGDGWEDQEIHNDSEETRMKALKMGANIISFAFLGD